MAEPSAQLERDLRAAVQSALSSRRPVLHHLNADTSWLLQIPRPENAVKRGARFYYNILVDPWFSGGQSDVASWFSQQFHATPSAIQSIAELEELIREAETLASELRLGTERKINGAAEGDTGRDENLIDVAIISHEFTDHCHKETLLELHADVPIFAGKEAAKLIESWGHFRTVSTVSVFGLDGDLDWRGTSLPPLPEYIGISRLLQADDVLNYHSAIMVTFNNRHGNAKSRLARTSGHVKNGTRKKQQDHVRQNEDEETAEAIVYTPHGIHSADLDLIPRAQPAISTLAFLHGLHNVRIGTVSGRTALQLNLGVYNGLKAQRTLQANYWIGTHDEVKKGGGLVGWFLQRDVLTLKDALDQERETRQHGESRKAQGELDGILDAFEDTNWVDLRNGESRVLL